MPKFLIRTLLIVYGLGCWSSCGLPSIGYLAPPTLVESIDAAQLAGAYGRITVFRYDEDDIVDDPSRYFYGFDLVYRVYALTQDNQRPWAQLLNQPQLDQPTGIQYLEANGFERFLTADITDLEQRGTENEPTISVDTAELGTFFLTIDPFTNSFYDARLQDYAVLYRGAPIPGGTAPPLTAVLKRNTSGDSDGTFWSGGNASIDLDSEDVAPGTGGESVDTDGITAFGILVFVAAVGFDDNDGSTYKSEPTLLKSLDGEDALIIELL